MKHSIDRQNKRPGRDSMGHVRTGLYSTNAVACWHAVMLHAGVLPLGEALSVIQGGGTIESSSRGCFNVSK